MQVLLPAPFSNTQEPQRLVQGLTSFSPQDKSGLLPTLVNKVLFSTAELNIHYRDHLTSQI